MRILFDHNTPAPLRYALREHSVMTAAELGWDTLVNGRLLTAAEEAGFEVLVTSDKGFLYEQNLSIRRVAVVVLSRGNWPDVKLNVSSILLAIESCKSGECVFVEFEETQ
jgi:predicted nuclease of predicted toxin-antitoxin system